MIVTVLLFNNRIALCLSLMTLNTMIIDFDQMYSY